MIDKKFYLIVPLILLLLTPISINDRTSRRVFEKDLVFEHSPSYTNERAKEVYEAVSQRSYLGFVRNLSEIGPRPFGSDNNVKAKNYIIEKLNEVSAGRIEVSVRGPSESVIGKLSGTYGADGPSIVIGGHYDSVEGAPGANDDASGVATALELARVLSAYSWPLDIYFCAWNAEEIGLVGSNEVAKIFRSEEISILVYINIDMILFPDNAAPQDEKVILGYDSSVSYHYSKMWANLVRVMNHNYGNLVTTQMPSSEISFWRRSDHFSFIGNGYRGILNVFESGIAKDTAYHRPTDTWDNPAYDYTLATEAVASMGSAIAFVVGGTHQQRIQEKHLGNIGMNSQKNMLVEITAPTNLTVSSSWDEFGSSSIELIGPTGQRITPEMTVTTSNEIESVFSTPLKGTYKVIVHNSMNSNVFYTIAMEYDSDIEGNGILDETETWTNAFRPDDDTGQTDDTTDYTDLTTIDSDNDSISDYDEIYIYHTDHESSDSDDDSIPDSWEIQMGLDPNVYDANADYDFDGLINAYEYLAGTDPFNRDTDQDSMYDGWEWQYGLNPLVNDADEDLDGDGWSNIYELQHGSNPTVPDSAMVQILPSLQIYGVIGLVFVLAMVIRKD
ncbi:MAG: M28 family peptidase [Candidatus Lokiarchaeota archaeon]|nr:M28 family peptidase [Candidatus Lokiarchaeota archaeon]